MVNSMLCELHLNNNNKTVNKSTNINSYLKYSIFVLKIHVLKCWHISTFPMFPKPVFIKMPPYPPIFPSIEGSIPDQYASSLACFSNLYCFFTTHKVIMHILYKK